VAREFGVSRNTVRKYLGVSEPVRAEWVPRSKPVQEKIADRVEALFEEWRGRTTGKQRITGVRLHRQLLEEGYQVGHTSVYEYLRERRRREKEVYIPLVYRAGEMAEVDFFDVKVDLGGERKRVWKFLMRLMYSGHDFVWLYEHSDQISFLDAHVRAFEYFGGVPGRLIYDNLGPAVKRPLVRDRKLTERFQALVSHYLFEPCFTRPGEGHDKGGVEGRGKGIRLKHLVPIPRGATLEEISQELLAQVERDARTRLNDRGVSVAERVSDEREKLRSLPGVPFDPRNVAPVSVSSRSMVRLEGRAYSVPSHWARLEATAYVGVQDVRFVCRGEEEVYPKKGFGSRQVRYRHYLAELAHKPQAVRQVAVELIEELGEPYGQLWQRLIQTHGERQGSRVMAQILAAIVDHGEERITEALTQALASGRTDLLPLAQTLQQPTPQVAVPQALEHYQIESGHVCDYDWMLEGGER
jgi:transposase